MIRRVEAFDLRLPLKTPYHSSLGELTEFPTALVVVEDDRGRWGAGDCTSLPGYSWETAQTVWDLVCSQGPKILSMGPEQAFGVVSPHVTAAPFACTSILTALEMLAGEPSLTLADRGLSVPILGLANVHKASEAKEAVEKLLAAGFKTLKMKVGFDVEDDIVRTRAVQEALGDRGLVRIDANQSFSFADAARFVRSVDPYNIELFEQPFGEDEWDGTVELSKFSPLPLMLDEAIYRDEHIDKTAELGCAQFIKFKLMKSGSARKFAEQIEKARKLGLKVVIGNGVATEIGCYQESLVAAYTGLKTAGEQNGFLKPRDLLLVKPLAFGGGNIKAEPGYQMELDRDKLVALSVDRKVWEA